MIKVFVAVPTTGTILDVQTYALREMEKKFKGQIEFVYPEMCVRRIFHDFARNGMVEEFLKTDCDVLWFLDSDVAPPTTLWTEYLKYYEEWSVAGAPYPVFMGQKGLEGPQVVYTVYNGTDGVGLKPSNVPLSGVDYVDGLATGCLFIKRHIFEDMPQPWFEFKYNQQSREMTEGEDLGFVKKVNAMGYRFFVDYSQVCKHYKSVCLRDVNDYAMTYAKNQIKAYDASARAELALAKERLGRKTKIVDPHTLRPPKF